MSTDFNEYFSSRLQMIRLTQPELVHDKKQQDSSSPDDGTATIKKEADAEPVTDPGTEVAFVS